MVDFFSNQMDALTLEQMKDVNIIKAFIASLPYIKLGIVEGVEGDTVFFKAFSKSEEKFSGRILCLGSRNASASTEIAEGDFCLCLFLDSPIPDGEEDVSLPNGRNLSSCVAIPASLFSAGGSVNASSSYDRSDIQFGKSHSATFYGDAGFSFPDSVEEAAITVQVGENRPVEKAVLSAVNETYGIDKCRGEDDKVAEVETSVKKQYGGLTEAEYVFGGGVSVSVGKDANGEDVECGASFESSEKTAVSVSIGKTADVSVKEASTMSLEKTADLTVKEDFSLDVGDGKTKIKISKDGEITIETQKDVGVKSSSGNVTVEATGGEVKLTGSKVTIGGTVTPDGTGALCGIPNCLFTGAPHTGKTSMGA